MYQVEKQYLIERTSLYDTTYKYDPNPVQFSLTNNTRSQITYQVVATNYVINDSQTTGTIAATTTKELSYTISEYIPIEDTPTDNLKVSISGTDISNMVSIIQPYAFETSYTESNAYRGETLTWTVSNYTREDVSFIVQYDSTYTDIQNLTGNRTEITVSGGHENVSLSFPII